MDTFLHTLPHSEPLSLPEQFTYPFHYTPHPLCVQAAQQVQAYLQTRTDWHDELQQGKMFGVLVVKDTQGQIGFLAAFSGNLAGSNHHPYFVPPVYDLLDPNGYFKQEEARISSLHILLSSAQQNMEQLKEERKQRSIALQQWIFRQFRLRNAR
ncbi:MAG: RNA pseudouridine synthase, partial [Bacteroidaceae bacterium]|nr:RNA pseudouridine synthase [Bacteroidaceae bacterium]